MQKLIFLIVAAIYFSGCSHDIGRLQSSMTQNYQMAQQCDTTNTVISYSIHIAPILVSSCGANNNSCHSSNSTTQVLLDFWAGANYCASTGKLKGSVTWDGTAINMPKNSTNKIASCDINKIIRWVNTGAPNN